MSLNVGGAVLGVAVLTVIANSVTSDQGGPNQDLARLRGYRAAYYGTVALGVLGTILSLVAMRLWSSRPNVANEQQPHPSDNDKDESNNHLQESDPRRDVEELYPRAGTTATETRSEATVERDNV